MDLEKLRKKILEFNKAYEQGKPLVEDYIYDFYKKKLEIMERFEKNQTSNLIGSEFTKKPIPHLFPILSLNHEFGKEMIDSFINKIGKQVNPFPLISELKIDGVSLVVRYVDGEISQIKTRGNGYNGENIFHLKNYLNIPNKIKIKETLELRFEAYFDKNFIKNPRNAAAGILLKKTPDINLKFLKFAPHNLYSEKTIWSEYIELRNIFKEMHLNPIEPFAICNHIEDCYDFFDKIKNIRNNLPHEIDGIVFKINDKIKQDILGHTAKAPRHSFAIKFENLFNIAEIKKIEFQVGRQGTITPIAIIEETKINNRKITKATLNNLNNLKNKNYNIGDLVKIEMAGDVIPKITEIIEKINTEKIECIKCPSCNSLLKNEICINGWNCFQQKLERLRYFASKQCLNIKNLGDQQIEFFINEGILNFPYDFFEIQNNINKIKTNPPWLAEKSLQKILDSIEESKYCTIEQFYTSLGLPNIGKNKGKLIAEKFKNFDIFLNAKESDLNFLGKNISKKILEYLKSEKNWIKTTWQYLKINQKYKKIDLFDMA